MLNILNFYLFIFNYLKNLAKAIIRKLIKYIQFFLVLGNNRKYFLLFPTNISRMSNKFLFFLINFLFLLNLINQKISSTIIVKKKVYNSKINQNKKNYFLIKIFVC